MFQCNECEKLFEESEAFHKNEKLICLDCLESYTYKWKFFGDQKPPMGKLLNVFRYKNKRYVHATYYITKPNPFENDPDEINTYEAWGTQHGSVHPCSALDAWCEFDYLRIPEAEKVFDGNDGRYNR